MVWEPIASWETFSPLRRGWSALVPDRFPQPNRSPRSGGDGPLRFGAGWRSDRFSPLRRGWSRTVTLTGTSVPVLPAQAGMVRGVRWRRRCECRSPRSGGDGPFAVTHGGVTLWFSPLRRGWSLRCDSRWCHAVVLPAQAGMVPRKQTPTWPPRGSPRSGGDGPRHKPSTIMINVVLPAQAGMVRNSRVKPP
ncbi:hypothetical protein CDES_01755 [Corynebacterium deserti GIMN1.010]|uniref:Uncharacterized protein n=1 Tax=Corynebacterium deserti GIMN1.010 TaxID=931089 RepID=A0A0M4CMX5_9CORY|nr:hypothetical protein CDES_01755 [Corynebacterium deserti GIMN1.010]